jgi:hypothetical protein
MNSTDVNEASSTVGDSEQETSDAAHAATNHEDRRYVIPYLPDAPVPGH